jgi:hypothetical protein
MGPRPGSGTGGRSRSEECLHGENECAACPDRWHAGDPGEGGLVSGHCLRVRLDDGAELVADAVVAAPGVGYFRIMPDLTA